MVCAGTAWQWYSPSLEPWAQDTFGLTSAQTGLVFMAFGLTYTVFTSLFGLLTDRGLDGLTSMVVGSLCILATFIFLGPVPPLSFLGSNLGLTIAAIALQGVGSAAVYIGSLLYMMKGVSEAGLPDKEQTRGESSAVNTSSSYTLLTPGLLQAWCPASGCWGTASEATWGTRWAASHTTTTASRTGA